MTSKNENKELLTKKNQPIKTITQQDINALEQLSIMVINTRGIKQIFRL